jgi:hydroxyacylglutathione hydrolase
MRVFMAAAPPFMKNGFVIACGDSPDAVLVDPGDEVEDLLSVVRAEDLRVSAILLTHAHLDHISGVGRAKAALDAPVWLHHDDLVLYDGIVEQGMMFGLFAERQPPVDRFYDLEPNAPALRFGSCSVQVRHTPGHCPGGVCLAIGPADQAERELFVGDTLFAGSIGRTDLPGGDYETLIHSIHTELLSFPDSTVVHSGHGPDTTIGEERRSNPFLVRGLS